MSPGSLDVFALTISRTDGVGYVLLVVALVFAALGYALSRAGMKLDAATKKVVAAAEKAQTAAQDAQVATAQVGQTLAASTGNAVESAAGANLQVAQTTSAMHDQVAQINDALAALTGNQAPARVMWALTTLCVLAALVSFDIVSLSIASNAPQGATT